MTESSSTSGLLDRHIMSPSWESDGSMACSPEFLLDSITTGFHLATLNTNWAKVAHLSQS